MENDVYIDKVQKVTISKIIYFEFLRNYDRRATASIARVFSCAAAC